MSCEMTFKYLGVVFDNSMTSKSSMDYVCKNVASRVSILGCVCDERQQYLLTVH